MCKYFYFMVCLTGVLTASAQVGTNASGPAKVTDVIPLLSAEAATKAAKAPELSVPTETKFDLDDKHILGPGDQLSFLIKEDKDLPGNPNRPQPLKVTDARDLEVPYIGRISVKDKTCKEVAAEIKVLLEKDYYYTATVKLGLDQVNKLRGKVYVTGSVRNPGSLELLFDDKLTASMAIVKCGGFSDFADKRKVRVLREAKPGEHPKPIEINMTNVLDGGKTDEDVVLEPGDSVIIGQRLVNFK